MEFVVYDKFKNLEELDINEYNKIAEQDSLYKYDKTCKLVNDIVTVWGWGKFVLGVVTVFI